MHHLNGDGVQNGVKSALYDRFAATILAYLCQLVSHQQDAEDLLLEVFIAAFNNEMLLGLPARRQLAWLLDRHFFRARGEVICLPQAFSYPGNDLGLLSG